MGRMGRTGYIPSVAGIFWLLRLGQPRAADLGNRPGRRWQGIVAGGLRRARTIVCTSKGKCQFSLFKLLTAVAEFWQVGGDAASTAP